MTFFGAIAFAAGVGVDILGIDTDLEVCSARGEGSALAAGDLAGVFFEATFFMGLLMGTGTATTGASMIWASTFFETLLGVVLGAGGAFSLGVALAEGDFKAIGGRIVLAQSLAACLSASTSMSFLVSDSSALLLFADLGAGVAILLTLVGADMTGEFVGSIRALLLLFGVDVAAALFDGMIATFFCVKLC